MRLLLALLAFWALGGCDSAPEPAADWPAPSPALWEVTDSAGRARGWLFGTVHALPDGVEWRTPRLDETLAAADVLFVEIADLDAPGSERQFRALATATGLPPLLRRVPPADREAVAALLDKADYEESDFAQLESWAAALMLGNAVRQGDPANGVDRALIAQMDEVAELEGMTAQLRLFDRLAAGKQADLLAAVAREAAAGGQREALLAWLTGSLDTLETQARADGRMLADPELHEALVAARNRRWVPLIARALETGRRPLVAVGALHLPGEDGLLALLEARGYILRRIQ